MGERLSRHPTPPVARPDQPAAAGAPDRRADRVAQSVPRFAWRTASLRALRPPSSGAVDRGGSRAPVAAVGHQPDCSEIAFALTGSDPGFPAAGVCSSSGLAGRVEPLLESRPTRRAFQSISSNPYSSTLTAGDCRSAPAPRRPRAKVTMHVFSKNSRRRRASHVSSPFLSSANGSLKKSLKQPFVPDLEAPPPGRSAIPAPPCLPCGRDPIDPPRNRSSRLLGGHRSSPAASSRRSSG